MFANFMYLYLQSFLMLCMQFLYYMIVTDVTRPCNESKMFCCGGKGEKVQIDSRFCCGLLKRAPCAYVCIPSCFSEECCPCLVASVRKLFSYSCCRNSSDWCILLYALTLYDCSSFYSHCKQHEIYVEDAQTAIQAINMAIDDADDRLDKIQASKSI